MKRWKQIYHEYRRIRSLGGGASYGKLEAFGKAIADTERNRRWERGKTV